MTPVKTATDQLTSKEFKERDLKAKVKMKEYADTRRHANSQTLQLGDRVLVKTPKINKFFSHYDPVPYELMKWPIDDHCLKTRTHDNSKQRVLQENYSPNAT